MTMMRCHVGASGAIVIFLATAFLLSSQALANDISNPSWTQNDAGNIAPPPNGWPPNMNPAQVRPTEQAEMGAIKRWHDYTSCTVTSSGTANAQTLTYTQGPQALVNGDIFCFYPAAGLTNTGPTTLNINGLGPLAITTSAAAALIGGELPANNPIMVVYDGIQFRILPTLPSRETIPTLTTGTLVIDSTLGTGGEIGLDNNHPIVEKDTSGVDRSMISIFPDNTLRLGDSNIGTAIYIDGDARVVANGYASRTGIAGSFTGNAFNIGWTGAQANLWIDSSNIGQIMFNGGSGYSLSSLNVTGNLIVTGGGAGVPNSQAFFSTSTLGNPVSLVQMDASNHLNLGATSLPATTVYANGGFCNLAGAGWSCTSDRRLKDDIRLLDGNTVELIGKLKPVSFVWKPDKEKHRQLGFVAQDVEEIFPEMVSAGPDGMKALSEDQLIAPLVLAVQELTKRVDTLEKELQAARQK